jgi:hypothetical protein
MYKVNRLAGSAAHTLNNITGVLYAALDHLDGSDDKSAERARRAIERACGKTLALSASLSLTALEPAEVKEAVSRKAILLQSDHINRIFLSLQEVCGAECEHDPDPWHPVPIKIDRNTLQAALVCVGASLLHASAALHCSLGESVDPSGHGRSITFEFSLENHEFFAESQAYAKDPCVLALELATPLLLQLGLHIDTSEDGRTRVEVKLDLDQ